MSASIFMTQFVSTKGADPAFPLDNLSLSGGVFSPASPITPKDPQQVLPVDGVPRAAVRVEDIYINSTQLHDLNLYYRPRAVTAWPAGLGPAFNDTLIYSYVGRTNVNPFHVDDDDGRRLKKLVFGQVFPSTGIPAAGGGTLQFQIPLILDEGQVRVTIHWSLVSPGGGIGT